MCGRKWNGKFQGVPKEMFDDVGSAHAGTRKYEKICSIAQKNQEQDI